MPKQLLFYDLVTPISTGRHLDWAVTAGNTFSFAADTNSVPLMTTEFLAAAREYPIVFSAAEDAVLPVAILGLDSDASLFVSEDGHWNATYIPAFIRRYPFVFSASEDGETLTLCIDEAFEGIDRKGKTGERLFTPEGERTEYLSKILEFTNAYQTEHRRTRMFGAIIKELDLLEPSQAKITLPDGSTRSLTGFHCVSRERVKAVGAEKLKELVGNDALELIYLHLYSMGNFDNLLRKFTTAAPKVA